MISCQANCNSSLKTFFGKLKYLKIKIKKLNEYPYFYHTDLAAVNFFVSFFLGGGAHPRHMGVPRLGVELEL